jgi:hypothetical protein
MLSDARPVGGIRGATFIVNYEGTERNLLLLYLYYYIHTRKVIIIILLVYWVSLVVCMYALHQQPAMHMKSNTTEAPIIIFDKRRIHGGASDTL